MLQCLSPDKPAWPLGFELGSSHGLPEVLGSSSGVVSPKGALRGLGGVVVMTKKCAFPLGTPVSLRHFTFQT